MLKIFFMLFVYVIQEDSILYLADSGFVEIFAVSSVFTLLI